ncbi:MAG: TlpA family protein disulfide reductase [Chloroflexi bacterium]|nr:TlpA family protein disulfide reductase [Chloroflexota bacterium]
MQEIRVKTPLRGKWRAIVLGVILLMASCSPEGQPAPDFTVTTLDGSDFTLSEYRGKVVIMYAMAAWCPSCIPEAKALARIFREYRGRGVEVLVLDVDTRETGQHLRQFKDFVQGGEHYWALDEGNRWALAYEIKALDSTIIVDQQGRIAYRDEVSTSYERLKEEIQSLLGEPN